MRTTRNAVLALLATLVAAHLLHASLGLGGRALDGFFDTWVYTGVELAAVVLCLLRGILVRTERSAWLVLGVAMLLWFGGDLLWTVWLGRLESAPFPSVADALYIAYYALAYVGQVLLLRARLRPFALSLWLEGLVAGLALAGVCAALAFGAILAATKGDGMTVAVTLAYPVGDLLLLCFVGIAFGATRWRPGAAWTFIALSLLLSAVADGGWAYLEALGRYDSGSVLTPLWPASMVAMAAAAWQRPARRDRHEPGLEMIVAPVAFSAVALGLLVYGELHAMPLVAALLAAAALTAAGARGTLMFLENAALLRRSRVEALTDALSGLGNRRRLMHDIDDALAAARAGRAQTLVFFDLDGFKGYNDSFGHNAGDALLARLGHRLEQAVAGHGTAYRVGGDEFCVVLDRRAEHDEPLVLAVADALCEHGDGFSIGASFGLVTLPDDAYTATLALQLADERMYAHKGSRPASPRRQARDLLLQILTEREPRLRRHMDDVAGMAVAVARRLGLTGEAIEEIARAAELHDIGKIAVPDSILHKPGPLDDLEWELMRQHTVVGERILAAAPALAPVARLVRSSHERWDGGGYPDRLAGDDIPVGARIIAMCDAYDAMTVDRAYRPAMTTGTALAELRRCAGTQFDPALVDAFVAVVTETGARAPAPLEA